MINFHNVYFYFDNFSLYLNECGDAKERNCDLFKTGWVTKSVQNLC